MFNSVGNNPQRQSFRFAHGFRTCFTIRQDTGQIRHISNPTAIFLLFDFNMYLTQTCPQSRKAGTDLKAELIE